MPVVWSAHAWRSDLSRGFLPLDRRCGLKEEEEEEGRSSAEALAHSDSQVFGDSDRKRERSSVAKVGVRGLGQQRQVRRVRTDASQAWPVSISNVRMRGEYVYNSLSI